MPEESLDISHTGARMSLLLFKKQFIQSIRAGQKTTTIRRWTTSRVRERQRAFAPGIGWLIIEAVEQIAILELTPADAQSDGFASKAEMIASLRDLYPDPKRDGKQWFRVRFRLDELI